MRTKIEKLLSDRELRKIVIIFAICKVLVISVAVVTQFFVPVDITHTQRITDNIFLNPFAQYDATAYLDIAQNGYRNDFGEYVTSNYHWYPLFPFLIRSFSFVGYPLAAFLISNIASFFAVYVLWLLVKEEVGKAKARKTIIYTLLFPTAFYFTMMYTESLFLLFSVSIFYFAKKNNWLLVGVFGFLIALTRMQGVLLFLPTLYIYFRSIGFKIGRIKYNSLFFLGLPLGVLTFMLYEYLITGDALIQFRSAVGFGKSLSFPWDSILFSIRALFVDATLINLSYHIYTLVVTAAFIALLYFCYKRLKPEYTIYFALNVLVILVSSSLFGFTRYMLIAFPAFMVLSTFESKRMKYLILIAYVLFVLLMVGSIVLHVTQRINIPLLYTPLF